MSTYLCGYCWDHHDVTVRMCPWQASVQKVLRERLIEQFENDIEALSVGA